MVLGHSEWLFITNGCESIIMDLDVNNPKFQHCVAIVVAGFSADQLKGYHTESAAHPCNPFYSFCRNVQAKVQQPCNTLNYSYIVIGSTLAQGTVVFTLCHLIGHDLSKSDVKALSKTGFFIGYILSIISYWFTFSSVASVTHAGILPCAVVIGSGTLVKVFLSEVALHDCNYCHREPAQSDAPYNSETSSNRESRVYIPCLAVQKSLLQRFARAAAHDIPGLARATKYGSASFLSSLLSTLGLWFSTCLTKGEKVKLYAFQCVVVGGTSMVTCGLYNKVPSVFNYVKRKSLSFIWCIKKPDYAEVHCDGTENTE